MVQRRDQKTIAGSRKPEQKWGEVESASLPLESSQTADLHWTRVGTRHLHCRDSHMGVLWWLVASVSYDTVCLETSSPLLGREPEGRPTLDMGTGGTEPKKEN